MAHQPTLCVAKALKKSWAEALLDCGLDSISLCVETALSTREHFWKHLEHISIHKDSPFSIPNNFEITVAN